MWMDKKIIFGESSAILKKEECNQSENSMESIELKKKSIDSTEEFKKFMSAEEVLKIFGQDINFTQTINEMKKMENL